jgi:lipopolysaccharide cholinephosphotransferase
MTQEYLEKLQKKTLATLKFAINFFQEHNLRYYACGGTCLGAVRHHNMIPWDDDVDLFMPYEDYKKLILLKKDIDDTGNYKLLTPETPGYYDPVCRITDTSTSIWRYYLNAIIFGTQIDIFPLYETNIEDDKVLTRMLHENFEKTWRFQRANQKYPLIRFWENIQNHHPRGLLKNIKWALSTRNVDRYKKELDDFQATLNVSEGKRLVSFASYIYGLETYEKEWFAEYTELPFADFKIRVPINYDAYLKSVYGDYMKLPPKEKQKPAHGGYYINLSEGLTIDEVRKRIRKGERRVL